MRQSEPPKPAIVAGFLFPGERRMINRQRLLLTVGLDLKAAQEAQRWIKNGLFKRRRWALMLGVSA